jgi:hypothetical protein
MTKRVILAASSLTAVAASAMWIAASTGRAQAPRAITGYQAPVQVDTGGLPGPVQPIFYRHDIHAGQFEMDCRYCHFSVEVSPSAGLPTLSTCMGCHILAGAGNPEVQKLRDAWNERRPVEWVEVHRVAPFVKFPHHRHVQSEKLQPESGRIADLCAQCHGPIDRMPQVYQFASLKMGWCLDCHKRNEVTTDCTACHY